MKADLHMHSTWSDGLCTMRELVDKAHLQGIDIIAITDHDVVGDIDDAIRYAQARGITVLPGIELSTLEQNKSVHLLGYFTDQSYHSAELKAYFIDIKTKRERRAKTIIENLKHFNDIHITYERVLAHARGIIARPHIAKAIHESYPVYDHDYIFDHFIGDHCDAYVPSVELPVEEGIALLRRNHCVVILAHPTLLKPHIKDYVLSLDYDGIEARYIRNLPGEEAFFVEWARQRDLFITAGSDFHGIQGDTKHGDIGDVVLDGLDLDRFLARLKKTTS